MLGAVLSDEKSEGSIGAELDAGAARSAGTFDPELCGKDGGIGREASPAGTTDGGGGSCAITCA